MTPAAQMPDPASVAPAAMRGDLVEREQVYLGRTYVILKNPLSLGYYRLPVAHVAAARMFDGKVTLGAMVESLRKTSAYWRGMTREDALDELFALAQQLGAAGLLRVRAWSAGERAKRLRDLKKAHRFESAVGTVLYFKKALYDPDRLLERMMPFVGWLFSWPAMLACALFMLVTLGVSIRHWDEITTQGANFFTLENLGLSWVLFLGVKVVHEFGHALTCKRHGGEVHEMGFMFILFTPYLFCNVSDSWLERKGARIATTSAGIIVELFLACVATWVWLFTQPGLLHQMCFNTMFLCSISTVIFNANPLMKFDGYYIMTDLLEIPNLRAKSNAWITRWAQRTLLGMKAAGRRMAGHEVGPMFGIYAVAAYLYGWLVMYRISIHMLDMLAPYGLEAVSRAYVALFLFVSIGLPFYRLARSLPDNNEFRTSGMARLRLIGTVALAVVALLFVTPWRETIRRGAALEHGKIAPVSSVLPGFLREVSVKEGQFVRAGDRLGRLENTDVESQLADVRLQREAALVRQRAALTDSSTEARLSVPVLQKFVSEADTEIKALEERLAKLTLRAPIDGVVRTKRPADFTGIHYAAGQPVIEVGDASSARLIIPFDEKQARRVKPGQKVSVRFDALPGRTFHGTITVAPVTPVPRFSIPAFANVFGGDVPAEPDAAGHIVPSLPHYEAEARLDMDAAALASLRAQASAHAKVAIRSTTLGIYMWDRLLDLIDPGVRL